LPFLQAEQLAFGTQQPKVAAGELGEGLDEL